MKVCARCKCEKPLACFGTKASGRIRSWCRSCSSEAAVIGRKRRAELEAPTSPALRPDRQPLRPDKAWAGPTGAPIAIQRPRGVW